MAMLLYILACVSIVVFLYFPFFFLPLCGFSLIGSLGVGNERK